MASSIRRRVTEDRTPVDFIDYEFDVNTDNYSELIDKIRTELGAETVHGINALPPKIVGGKMWYVRLTLREGREGPRCVVYFRATDLYFVAFQTQAGDLRELKPDDPKSTEITKEFLDSAFEDDEIPPYKVLPFNGSYIDLTPAAGLNERALLPIGFSYLRKAIRNLASPVESGRGYSHIAMSILVIITFFPESARLRNVERMITSGVYSFNLGSRLCYWTNAWAKVSTVIAKGEGGRSERLEGLNLTLYRNVNLRTVEQARVIIGILKRPTRISGYTDSD